MEHRRNGELLSYDHHAGVLTNIGKDFIEQQISGSASTTNAIYIACSNTTDTPLATWTIVPDEISTDGLSRATGAYSSTGTGTWNVTYTFNVSGTNSTQCYGLHYSATSLSDNNLLCADTSSQKNMEDGDTLKVTFQGTAS